MAKIEAFEKVLISDFIGFSGFGISRILETRGPGHNIS
jgi:hypothetical protein